MPDTECVARVDRFVVIPQLRRLALEWLVKISDKRLDPMESIEANTEHRVPNQYECLPVD